MPPVLFTLTQVVLLLLLLLLLEYKFKVISAPLCERYLGSVEEVSVFSQLTCFNAVTATTKHKGKMLVNGLTGLSIKSYKKK